MHPEWKPYFPAHPIKLPKFDFDFKTKVDEKLVEKLTSYIKQSLKEREKLGYDKIIVGYSGGVDSTISMLLLKRALPENSVAIQIEFENPSEPSPETAFSMKIADKVGIAHELINATDLYNKHLELFKANSIVAKTHLRSRLAVNILFQYADNNNALVLDTTDKSEAILHLYEESFRGHISPLRNLYRAEIHDLADYFDMPELKDKPAGCPDLTNADALGALTQEVDPLLYLMVEKQMSPDELVAKYKLDEAWLKNLYRRIQEQPLRTQKTVLELS